MSGRGDGYPRWLLLFIELTSPGFWIYLAALLLVSATLGILHVIKQQFRR